MPISPAAASARVKDALGAEYDAVNLGGYWVIGRVVPGPWERVSPDPLRRSLDRAIEDAARALRAPRR